MAERFLIRMYDHNTGRCFYSETEGKIAFEYRGYRFFVHDDGYKVSDCLCGVIVAKGDFFRNKTAVEVAKEFIEKNFDRYIQEVKRIKKTKRADWRRKELTEVWE